MADCCTVWEASRFVSGNRAKSSVNVGCGQKWGTHAGVCGAKPAPKTKSGLGGDTRITPPKPANPTTRLDLVRETPHLLPAEPRFDKSLEEKVLILFRRIFAISSHL
jgi:hypothetical protein